MPPDAPLPVLWHFRLSHYNEKARWALDWKGVPHARRMLLPGWHIAPLLLRTGQKQVPVLVLDDRTIPDSTAIIAALESRWPDPPLYPADPDARRRALELEDWLDVELGPHVRRAAFHRALPHADFACALLTGGTSRTRRALYRATFPLTRVLMRFDMGIDDARAADSRTRTRAAMDRLAGLVGPSGHLVGDAFSVADLTAAALLAPLVGPAEFPYPWPDGEPEALQALRREARAHAIGAWVLETYARHRPASCAVADG
ncbi:MAG: glutathione S-transferase N-terminal domain-containing protein [bacterium]|nr:glutathione S-transferase N-terminal domain-containing protein [bacterium]